MFLYINVYLDFQMFLYINVYLLFLNLQEKKHELISLKNLLIKT